MSIKFGFDTEIFSTYRTFEGVSPVFLCDFEAHFFRAIALEHSTHLKRFLFGVYSHVHIQIQISIQKNDLEHSVQK
jgi:hypothetical protein